MSLSDQNHMTAQPSSRRPSQYERELALAEDRAETAQSEIEREAWARLARGWRQLIAGQISL